MRTAEHLGLVRRAVLEWATEMAFGTVERTKFVTAASELGRNTMVHGKGGTMTITEVERAGTKGLQLRFEDNGPGIENIEQALQDGFSSVGSLGLGLGGARRLVNEFEILSEPWVGTTVTVVLWKRR